jgi:hypothetical protein
MSVSVNTILIKKMWYLWVLVAHTCNPFYSGGSLKLFEASPGKYLMRLALKSLSPNIGLVEWLKVKALSSSPSTPPHTHKQKCDISVAWDFIQHQHGHFVICQSMDGSGEDHLKCS